MKLIHTANYKVIIYNSESPTFSNSMNAYCNDSFVFWSLITSQLQKTMRPTLIFNKEQNFLQEINVNLR